MQILNNITSFFKLLKDDQFEKVHKLQARRKELKVENRKKKATKKRTSKVKQSKEEKMLAQMSPELRAIFLKKP